MVHGVPETRIQNRIAEPTEMANGESVSARGYLYIPHSTHNKQHCDKHINMISVS